MIARKLTIHGRVQGVFYRDWTVKTARELGLVGWVRNCLDGSVEAVVQGDTESVERLVALAKDGPPAAIVERIDTSDIPAEDLSDFEKRATR